MRSALGPYLRVTEARVCSERGDQAGPSGESADEPRRKDLIPADLTLPQADKEKRGGPTFAFLDIRRNTWKLQGDTVQLDIM